MHACINRWQMRTYRSGNPTQCPDLQGKEIQKRRDVCIHRVSHVAQSKRISLPIQKMQIQSLGLEDLLEKEMATRSSVLAWAIPWVEEPGRLQSMESQKSWTQLSD